jgi:hypothetical protein
MKWRWSTSVVPDVVVGAAGGLLEEGGVRVGAHQPQQAGGQHEQRRRPRHSHSRSPLLAARCTRDRATPRTPLHWALFSVGIVHLEASAAPPRTPSPPHPPLLLPVQQLASSFSPIPHTQSRDPIFSEISLFFNLTFIHNYFIMVSLSSHAEFFKNCGNLWEKPKKGSWLKMDPTFN